MDVKFPDTLVLDEKKEAGRDPFLDTVQGVLNADAPFPDAPAIGSVIWSAYHLSAVLAGQEHLRFVMIGCDLEQSATFLASFK